MTETALARSLVGKVNQPRRDAGLASRFLVPRLPFLGDSEVDLLRRRVLEARPASRSFGCHAALLHTQIILAIPPDRVFNVYTLNKEAVMAKKKGKKGHEFRDGTYVFGEVPLEVQALMQVGLDEAREVVQRLETKFAPLKMDNKEQTQIAKAIYEALDSAFTRAAKE